ncbi:MAG: aldehyde reductase [Gammaproteobacteria bacterium GWE2_42_36]|nr:MAG: aldehyde reductase [Gammaproteobacteria bacterium GWE2_42_36]
MLNFEFYNPVKIYFGEGQIASLTTAIPKEARILITYGKGSIKKNGVYDQVKTALNGHAHVWEFEGIEPNPKYETLMKAVMLARQHQVDFLLAVGGGSIIDGTKFIAAAVPFEGEPWDILEKQATVTRALSFGSILTLPATGSEMNSGAVISRESTGDKLVFMNPLVFPKFAVLDPTTTYTLPVRQTANGIIDTFVHVMEQYLTYPVQAALQDRFSESILQTLIEEAPKVMHEPANYAARANIMWCATLGLNGLIGAGVPQDWATHMLGHEVTALCGLDHAQTLAVIMPSVMRVCRKEKEEKILQYGERIWGIQNGSLDERIELAITKTRDFFAGLGVKTRLRDYGVEASAIPKLLAQLKRHHLTALGEHEKIGLPESELIYQDCL